MGIWKMSQLKAPPLTDDAAELRKYLNYLSNQIAIMLKDLDFTLNGDINFQNVKAKSITADRMNVDELSAITANMGKLTSGEIYGAYIATKEAAYPRSEMSSTSDLFAAYRDADNHLKIQPDLSGSPGMRFVSAGSALGALTTYLGYLEIWVPSLLRLTAPTLEINGWSSLYSDFENKTLRDELDELKARLTAGGL